MGLVETFIMKLDHSSVGYSYYSYYVTRNCIEIFFVLSSIGCCIKKVSLGVFVVLFYLVSGSFFTVNVFSLFDVIRSD